MPQAYTRIDNWFPMLGGLVGKVSGHPHQHEFKSDVQVTSRLIYGTDGLREHDVVQTETGTWYKLGKPAEIGS